MKKLKNEHDLLKEAIRVGGVYLKKRGAGSFEETDSSDLKITAIYKLLVHDQLIQPFRRATPARVAWPGELLDVSLRPPTASRCQSHQEPRTGPPYSPNGGGRS